MSPRLLQNGFQATSVRLSVTPRCVSSLQQTQSLLLFKQTVFGFCLPVFRYIAAVKLFSNPLRLVLLNIFLLTFPAVGLVVESEIRVDHFRQVATFVL